MNVINKDYKDWYLKCRFEWRISEYPTIFHEKLLIITYSNKYLYDYLESLSALNYKIQESINFSDLSEEFSIIVIMTELSQKTHNEIEKKSKKYNFEVWNIYAKYEKYKMTKTPLNYIVNEFDTLDYEKYTRNKDRLAERYIKKTIERQYSNNHNCLFNKVEIETISRCNNVCEFCPVNKNSDTRPFAMMDEELFKVIIDQLADLKYDSCIALFSNNEPLLDKRLISFAEYARKKLPDNFMYIYTNGLLLSRELLTELLKYFDHIYINNYSSEKKLNPPIYDIWLYLQEKSINPEKVTIHMRDIKEKLSSRAGTAPNRTDHFIIKSSCLLPFNQLSIRANGKVSLCSIDALCQRVMGDLTKNSITDIWNSNEYNTIRKSLINGRSTLFPCRNCDMLFTTIPYENVR